MSQGAIRLCVDRALTSVQSTSRVSSWCNTCSKPLIYLIMATHSTLGLGPLVVNKAAEILLHAHRVETPPGLGELELQGQNCSPEALMGERRL